MAARPLNIVVCVKQVPASDDVRVNQETMTLVREGISNRTNPLDLRACEAALRLREMYGGRVTAISMGPPSAEEALKEALSLGVDGAVLLSDRAFAGSDTLATSYTLARAIRRLERETGAPVDLVVCGNRTTDGDTGQVGPETAAILGWPSVTSVGGISGLRAGSEASCEPRTVARCEGHEDIRAEGTEPVPGFTDAIYQRSGRATLAVERAADGVCDLVEVMLPAVISVSREAPEPRYPSVRHILRSRAASITVWGAADIEAEPSALGREGSPTSVVCLIETRVKRSAEVIEGTPAEKAARLAELVLGALGSKPGQGGGWDGGSKAASGTEARRVEAARAVVPGGTAREIMVFAEHRGGALLPAAREAISEALRLARGEGAGRVAGSGSQAELGAGSTDVRRGLAADGGPWVVSAVVTGSGEEVRQAVADARSSGAGRVYVVDHPHLSQFSDDAHANAVAEAAKRIRPEVLLFSATPFGRAVAPRVAGILRTGLTADCTSLSLDLETGVLYATRPAFGGNISATMICKARPQMVTLVEGAFGGAAEPAGRVENWERRGGAAAMDSAAENADVVAMDLDIPVPHVRVVESRKTGAEELPIQAASVAVAVGRGVSGKAYEEAAKLAERLGAPIVGTRPAVDMGLIPESRMVGQSGKVIRPKVYIACGISGALHHLVGMRDSEVIVAINSDPSAPIFGAATYGVVGKVEDILPRLLTELSRLSGTDAAGA